MAGVWRLTAKRSLCSGTAQPAGWQPEEEDAQFDELRLNVVEVK